MTRSTGAALKRMPKIRIVHGRGCPRNLAISWPLGTTRVPMGGITVVDLVTQSHESPLHCRVEKKKRVRSSGQPSSFRRWTGLYRGRG
eukprot:2156238-Pyramimonas_sp.AAC.1